MLNRTMTAAQATAVSVVASISAIVFTVLLKESDGWSILFYAISYLCFIPLIVFSLYMMATGKGNRWLNIGIDWRKVSADRAQDYTRYVGKYLILSLAMMLFGMSLLMHSITLMGILFVISLIIMIIPLRNTYAEKGLKKIPEGHEFNKKQVWGLTVAILAIVIIPTGILFSENSSTSEVTVTLDDESFIVVAPMFDHMFQYDDVDSIELVDDFDKGKRISGYSTSEIKSGHYRNGTLGDYQLASYAGISSCIVIYINGNAFAFNQSSDMVTEKMYNDLVSRMG